MRTVSLTATLLALLLGASVLVGWHFGLQWLTRPLPGSVAMNPTTALCFVLLALALMGTARPRMATALAWTVVALASIKLGSLLLGMPYSIDGFLYANRLGGDVHHGLSNRMAPNTATSFLLASLSLLLFRAHRRHRGWAELLALLTLALGALSLVGYLYRVPEFYGVLKAFPMAVHTSIGFILMGIAMVNNARPGPFMATMLSNGGGGLMARWLLPLAIGMPIGFGALRLYGERQGLYSGPFGLMLHVVIIIIFFCYIVWRVAVVVNERDGLRAKAELDLEQTNQLLEHRVEERTHQLKKIGQLLEEKAAQLQLKVKELADYKYAIDQGAIVAITDVKGRITEVNDNFCTISGYTRQELIGQDHRIINSGTHPPEFMRNLWVTIANGRVWRGEICNRAKDGTLYWVDTTIVPFMNAFGKPDHYLAIRAEITERKLAEQKLAASEERFRHTLDNMMEGAQIIGFDWKYQYVNAAVTRHGGLKTDQLLGRTMAECYPGIQHTELYGHIQRCMTDRVPHHMENHFEYPDGSSAWFELSIQPVPEGVFILSIDMTDRKLAEQAVLELNRSLEQKVTDRTAQLQASNKELESFTYSVSHDLRAPLRAISGFAQMLHQQHASQLSEDAQRLLGIISTNANTMGQLIDDLLHFSRTGRQQVRYAQVDMRRMAQQTVDDLLVHEPERRLQVQVEPMPAIDADAQLLQLVWTNLVSNALKYSAKVANPHIRIWATTDEAAVTYHVADNGVGFNMQYADKLFGVFQRLHSSREFEGTGVGLAIVQRIVLKHGGRVWAEAEVDKGATFHFSLPTRPDQEIKTPKTIQYEEDTRNTTG